MNVLYIVSTSGLIKVYATINYYFCLMLSLNRIVIKKLNLLLKINEFMKNDFFYITYSGLVFYSTIVLNIIWSHIRGPSNDDYLND